MKIEFFHDVICSFCFPMSYRMRKIQAKYPNIEISHHSFALAWDETDFDNMFGSRKQAKEEILSHWVHANQNDDLHRFNIETMKEKTFSFPTSKNGLLAAKSAEILGGAKLYWQVFDRLQEALFIHNQDIESLDVIKDIVKGEYIDWKEFEVIFSSEETLLAVKNDLKLAQEYGIHGVPFLVINGRYPINGAQSQEVIEETIEKIALEEHEALILVEEGSTCYLDKNGTWVCE